MVQGLPIGNAAKAFAWIVRMLRKKGIPVRVSGGLAARAYESKRPLYDIVRNVDRHFDNVVSPRAKRTLTWIFLTRK
ncbi:hypothetical protein AUJ65_02825 [Candidatus Micrarchaeota archaeon CG1_02_51_15]|nr:MAG: hypothetical protein AUJ65_02825 [Candidatus Micrarchaeota archaeon CG1_02_51_15]